MARLIRAVLIDSINRGSCIEVSLDANTALTGTNGIGKTSFLKLLAIFYGTRPSNLAREGGNLVSFSEWYLPRPTSFIIFDYENHEGHRCCVVVHHNSGTGYAYRLISGPWEPELAYLDPDAGQLVPPADLIAHCNRLGRTCTTALNHSTYRQIIQYNSTSGPLGDNDDIRQRQLIQHCRPRFSLAPRRADVAGIDTIILTLIDSGNSYSALRTVIADILQQDNDDPTSTLASFKADDFQQLIDNYEGCMLFEQHLIERIRKLDELGTEYESAASQLAKTKRRLSLLRDGALDERMLVREQLDNHRQEQRTYEDKAEENRVAVDGRLSEARVNFQEAETKLSRLDKQHQQYQLKKIDDMIALCQRQPILQAELGARETELKAIDQEGADVLATYQQLIQQEKDEYQTLIDTQQEQARIDQDTLENEQRVDQQRWDQEIKQRQEAHALERTPLQQQHSQVQQTLIELRGELDMTRRYKVLPEDQAAIDDALAAQSEWHHAVAVIDKEEREHNQHQEAWKSRQQELIRQQEGLDRSEKDAKTERLDLQRQLDASDTTLLGFLRKHYDDWPDTIGRVLSPGMLMREDLNPELVEGGPRTLYGIDLTLDGVEPAAVVSPDSIRAEISRLESELQSIAAERNALAADSSRLQREKKELDRQGVALRQRRANAESELEQRKSQYDGVRERASDKHRDRCDSLRQQVEHLDSQVQQVGKRLNEMDSEHKRELFNMATSKEQSRQDCAEKRDHARQASDTAIVELREKRDSSVRDLETKLDAALADKGINSHARRTLVNTINDLKRDLSLIDRQLPEVNEYQRWLTDEWSQRPDLNRAYEATEGILNQVQRERNELEAQSRQKMQEFKARRDTLNAALAELETTITTTDRVLTSLGHVDADPQATLQVGQTVKDLEYDAQVLIKRQQSMNKDAARMFDTISTLYLQRGLQKSPHAAHIDAIARQARQEAEDLGSAWRYAISHLAATATDFHDAQRQKLIVQGQSLGDKVCDSRGRLDTLHKSIMSLGREATKRAKAVAQSFKSLEIDEVKIQSQIRSLDFWTVLDSFEQHFKRWRGLGDDQLPSVTYIEAVKRVLQLLNTGRLKTTLPECFTLEVTLYDSNRLKSITNDQSFKASSSEGLKVLLQSMLFVSLFELLRKDADLQLIFPLDETLRLASGNYIPLLQALNERQIVTVAGFPEGSPEILAHFEHGYEFYRENTNAPLEIRQYVNPEPDELDALEQELALLEDYS